MKLAAYHGHKDAQYELAKKYAFGKGISRDLIKSREWFSRAAQSGNPKASLALSKLIKEI